MEKEVLQALAEAAGRSAAHDIIIELRAEIAQQFDHMKQALSHELKSDFAGYFGEMKPSQHIVQHDRLYRFVRWYDNLTESIATKLIMGTLMTGGIIGGGLWLAGKLFGIEAH